MIKVIKQPRLLKVWIEETLHTYIVGKIISIQSWKNEDNYFNNKRTDVTPPAEINAKNILNS